MAVTPDFLLMLQVKLPVVDRIDDKFATGVENEATGDSPPSIQQ